MMVKEEEEKFKNKWLYWSVYVQCNKEKKDKN